MISIKVQVVALATLSVCILLPQGIVSVDIARWSYVALLHRLRRCLQIVFYVVEITGVPAVNLLVWSLVRANIVAHLFVSLLLCFLGSLGHSSSQ